MQQIQDFKIRYLQEKDIPAVFEMSKKVVAKFTKDVDEDKVLASIYNGLENKDFSLIVLVDPEDTVKGYVFCSISEIYFATTKIACCLSIWVEEDSRKHSKDMMKAFESWAKYKQADQLMFSTFEGVSPKGLGSVYKRFGCSIQEVQYWKDLK